MRLAVLVCVAGFACSGLHGQNKDSVAIRSLYDAALVNGQCYGVLEHLTTKIGPRLSGSEGAAKAVAYMKQVMESYGFDRVYLQPVMVPHWVRGEKEEAHAIGTDNKKMPLAVCALGGSVGTPKGGVKAQVVEVKNLAELAVLGKEKLQGKIVFFNRPMDARLVNTFAAYGSAGDQRRRGPAESAKYGAVAVLVRSLTQMVDDYPHTGSTNYDSAGVKIPAAAISTLAAEKLSAALKANPNTEVYLKMNCQMLPDAESYNVVGEIKGSEKPEEIIVVGGHLDSWDLAQGAHDDGAGVVQSVEVLRIFKQLGMRPKRTIRAVCFMNEENGLRGGLKYAQLALQNNEKHIAAIESDRGGFTPRGFGIEAMPAVIKAMMAWQPLFAPYNVTDFAAGGGGADIGPLKPQGTVLIGYVPDPQRYFDFHHTHRDTFDGINRRELELGAAAMAALTYLLSEYGVPGK
jgi:hypothetical protein